MKKLCLLVLCGLPAAGKTSLSTYLLKIPQNEFKFLHLCYDYYLDFHSKTYQNMESIDYHNQRKKILGILEDLIKYFIMDISIPIELKDKFKLPLPLPTNNLVIICDDNHYYRSMRYKLLQICRKYNISYGQVYFNISLEESQRRNSLRTYPDHIPLNILERMFKRLEIPSIIDNSWESKRTLILESDYEKSIGTLFEFLTERLEHFEFEIPNSEKVPMPQSNVHHLDILLRRRIKELLNENLMGDKATKAKELNQLRFSILSDFRKLNLNENDASIDYEDYLTVMK